MTASQIPTPEGTPKPCAFDTLYIIPDPDTPINLTPEAMTLPDEIAPYSGPYSWMVSTVIEDDDLMFGGKPLCAWHEEDRRMMGLVDEEETRGRSRERTSPRSVPTKRRHHRREERHREVQGTTEAEPEKTEKE